MKISATKAFGFPLIALVMVNLLCLAWMLLAIKFDWPDRTPNSILVYSPPAVFVLSLCTLIAVRKAIKKQNDEDLWLLFVVFPAMFFSAIFLFVLTKYFLTYDSTGKYGGRGSKKTEGTSISAQPAYTDLYIWT